LPPVKFIIPLVSQLIKIAVWLINTSQRKRLTSIRQWLLGLADFDEISVNFERIYFFLPEKIHPALA
jgi:hypothetical protein